MSKKNIRQLSPPRPQLPTRVIEIKSEELIADLLAAEQKKQAAQLIYQSNDELQKLLLKGFLADKGVSSFKLSPDMRLVLIYD